MFKNNYFIQVSLLLILLLSACKDDVREVTLFDKGELNASASSTSIMASESVTFEDASTKVQSLLWSFDGGSPNSSTSSNVTVTYETGGTFEALLMVTFVDNTTAEMKWDIQVEGAMLTQV